MGAACTLLGGRLADKFGCRRMIRVSLACFITCLLVLVIAHNVYVAGALLFPIVTSLYFSYSPMVVLGQQYLPNHVGFASGITLGIAVSIGGIAVPLLGMLGDRFGLSAAFLAIAAIAVIPLVGSFFLAPAASEREAQKA